MPRVNVTIPNHVIDAARKRGLNVSAIATAALAAEIERQAKIERMRTDLDTLNVELGPVPSDAADAAVAWVNDMTSPEQAGSAA